MYQADELFLLSRGDDAIRQPSFLPRVALMKQVSYRLKLYLADPQGFNDQGLAPRRRGIGPAITVLPYEPVFASPVSRRRTNYFDCGGMYGGFRRIRGGY